MEKMENFVNESRPLDTCGGWEKQVNGRADEVEAEGRRQMTWAEQQEANRRAAQRIQRIMSLLALAVALIVAGGVYLNYVDGFPVWIAASVAVTGIAMLFFVVGWIFGHKSRR